VANKRTINIDDNLNLSEFFSLVSSEKKKKKEEFDSIVGDLNIESIFEEVKTLKKKNKIKKKKEEKTLEVFESWLYSDKVKDQPIEEVQEIVEEVIEEVQELVDNIVEEIETPEEQPSLIEKSLGLLAEPSDVKQQNDPLTPLDQKFATLDDLQKHYRTFLSRIQQQLSTLGGGGETRLEFLDDVDRDSVKTDNYFLQYDETINKWIGSNDGSTLSGIVTYIDAGPNIFVSSHVGIVTVTGIGLTIGDAPPADPVIYPLWWDSTVGKPYLYYTDGNSTQWVEFAPGCSSDDEGGGGANLPQNLDVTLGYGNTSNLGMNVGIVTAISYYGNGSTLSGIVTYLVAGTGIDISANTGVITINATGIGTNGELVQVNSNWNATTGITSILNKPVIPAAQVNSDWNATTGISSILNKPTIVNQIIAGTGITISPSSGVGTVTINASGLGTATRYYGSYYDTRIQSCSGIGVSTPMLLNSKTSENGFQVVDGSKITSTYGGVYNAQFSVQLDKPSGGAGNIWIWVRQNGVNLPYTTSKVSVQGTTSEVVASWDFIFEMSPGDYIQFMWITDDTLVQLTSSEPITLIDAPSTDVPVDVPAIPSVIVTIQQL
jgi:hypothetical protein